MALPTSTDILIVGAGPAGMACALSLHTQGFTDFTVVDCAVEDRHSSRASLLHAATLEALDPLGCAQDLVNAGKKAPHTAIWTNGRLISVTSFDLLAPYTKFPFGLVVPQNVSEKVLGAALQRNGNQVHRPYRVVLVQPSSEDPRMLDVHFEDGHTMRARCVVGADGARSVVRKSAGIEYADPNGELEKHKLESVLADVVFSTPIDPPANTAVNLIIKNNNIFLFSELPRGSYDDSDDRVFRIGANILPEMGAPRKEITVPYLQSLVEAFGPGKTLPVSKDPSVVTPVIKKAVWSTQFRTHSALAESFFARLGNQHTGGIVVLVGDAAHIHSPMGAQGMNLGICDAVALGRTLADTFNGEVHDAALRKWADMRRKRARNVIGIAEWVLRLTTTPDEITWICGILPVNIGKLRDLLLLIIGSVSYLRMMFAWQLSGLAARS